MGFREFLGLNRATEMALEPEDGQRIAESGPDAATGAKLDTFEIQLETAMETIADLQRENRGWALIGNEGTDGTDHGTLVRNADLVRAFSTMNPLMFRAKQIRQAYVWGGGVDIQTRSTEEKDYKGQDVAAVVEKYLDDTGNQAAVFGAQARSDLEGDLFDDGNVFVGHWVHPLTGDVKARTIPFNEIVDKKTAPGDRATTWFYLREWTEQLPNEIRPRIKKAWYPDIDFDPQTKTTRIDDIPVLWPGTATPGYGAGAAIYHVKVNPTGRNRKWGVGDGFAAMMWAKAYKGFLEDTAGLYHSLSKIARVISTTKDKTQLRRAAVDATDGAPGGTLYGDGMAMQTPSFSGIDTDQGRPYAAMVASATGIPVTVLTSDPGQEGARAVAETLDKPTRLIFEMRQEIWAEFIRTSVGYKIKQAVKAPRGPLKGSIGQVRDRTEVRFRDETDPSVQVDFPSLEDDNLQILVDAVTKAADTGAMPMLEILRLFLRAFKVENADDILEKYTDNAGEFIPPGGRTEDAAATAAINAYRRGGDPSEVL